MTFEFKIIDGMSDSVEQQVSALSSKGWTLTGSIQVRYLNGSGPYYTQTMKKLKRKRSGRVNK